MLKAITATVAIASILGVQSYQDAIMKDMPDEVNPTSVAEQLNLEAHGYKCVRDNVDNPAEIVCYKIVGELRQ